MIYFIFAVLIVLIDRGIKIWVSFTLEVGQSLQFIPGVLRIVHVENTGAAFSIFSDMRWPLVAVSAIASIVLIIVILRYKDGEFGKLAASFMLGGAVGNLVDRIATGKVVDMFEPLFIDFAVFNVADIFVTAGCLMLIGHLIYLMVQQSKAQKEAKKNQPSIASPDAESSEQDGAPIDNSEISERQILVEYYTEQGLDDDGN